MYVNVNVIKKKNYLDKSEKSLIYIPDCRLAAIHSQSRPVEIYVWMVSRDISF